MATEPVPGDLPRKLNLGCGYDYREGWWNVDKLPYDHLDQQMDFMKAPWPLPSEHFDHVVTSHVLEHVPPTDAAGQDGLLVVLGEIARILREGGTLEVVGPHPAMGFEYFGNPTHYRYIMPETFDYFTLRYPQSHLRKEVAWRFDRVSDEVTERVPFGRRFLRMGKSRLGLTQHLAIRVPPLRPLLNRVPYELRIVLRKVAA